MEKIKDIDVNLKSEPMNEMLAHPPAWLIRSGNGLILLILSIVSGLSWLISYPDEIIGNASVTTSQPPIELSNQFYTQIKSLQVTDGQKVKQHQLLIEFDNPANPGDIQKAIAFVDRLEQLPVRNETILPKVPSDLQLGAFQEMWVGLEATVADWNEAIQFGIESEQIKVLQREIAYRKELKSISGKKITLSESEYELIAKELKTSEQLADKNVISKQELHLEKRSENQAMQAIQSQKEQYVQNLIQLNALQRDLIQLKHEQRTNQLVRKNKLATSVANLRSKLAEWKKTVAFVAPANGKVLFNQLLQKNQYYKPGEASIVVVPNGSKYSALATINAAGAGKIFKGQKAMIELTDFPKNEYGSLRGVVTQITQIEKGGTYQVKISLPNQLTTTYGKKIPGKAQLNGNVKIITKNKRLLVRLFEKLSGYFL